MKIAICLLIKDENEYLDEWLNHHRDLGFNHFYIYDNHSAIPVAVTLKGQQDVSIKLWDNKVRGTQVDAYNDCCQLNQDNDFILFLDTDEFVMIDTRFKSIQQMVAYLQYAHGKISAIGIYWRIYGKTNPYFSTRQPVTAYTQYLKYTHIKTLANPREVIRFLNPHYACIKGNYISETGRKILGPFSEYHSSDLIWIKHLFTRSKEEFKEKILRGSGDKVNREYNLSHFYYYNDHCNLSD
jgi:hypothetical protein